MMFRYWVPGRDAVNGIENLLLFHGRRLAPKALGVAPGAFGAHGALFTVSKVLPHRHPHATRPTRHQPSGPPPPNMARSDIDVLQEFIVMLSDCCTMRRA